MATNRPGPPAPVLGPNSPPSVPPSPTTRWLRFFGGLTAILLFAFVGVPGLQRWGPVAEVQQVIRNSGIDATALFYTDIDASNDGESSIRNAIRYAGQSGHPSGSARPERDEGNAPD